MGRIALLKGSYNAKSIIADAQACVNLYIEKNDDQEKPFTLYPTPGLTLLSTPPVSGPVRCQYVATNGNFYRVIGQNIYLVSTTWVHTFIGAMHTSTGIVSACDNTLAVVFVDGTTTNSNGSVGIPPVGYAVDLNANTFGAISSPYFFGASQVGTIDTYLVFNDPGTNGWYISLSNASFQMLTGTYGGVLTGTITDAGTGGVAGTYAGVALTGGSGTGAIATIVVSGGGATKVTITTPGINYNINDVVSATFGSVTGFAFTVNTASGIAFDPLAYATKSGTGDIIESLAVVHNEAWLIGSITTEVWYDAGNADFAFARLPGVFIQKGTSAIYSIAQHNEQLFWLAGDRDGGYEIVTGENYQVVKISNYALDNALSGYSMVSDAIGYCYEQEGHSFYVCNFPTANVTWVYDIGEKQWHQRAYTDVNGVFNRHLGLCGVFAHQTNTVGDYINGNLYKFDLTSNTDNGNQIVCLRRFPHVMNDLKRVQHMHFEADMQAAGDNGSADGSSSLAPPMVYLSWSDDRGATYGNPVGQSLGSCGQTFEILRWNRLGLARDRIYQLMWSAAAQTALNGAFLETKATGS